MTSGGRVLRVLTYNVRGLKDDGAAVRRVVLAARADVVCFQEAPGGPLWRERCSALARGCDLLFVSGGRPAAGNMIAVAPRVDVYGTQDGALSRTPGRQLARTRPLARRGISTALLGLGSTRFGVVGLHGGLSAAERGRHAGEILAAVDRLRGVGAVGVVAAGDLNADPASAEWRELVARCSDAYAGRGDGSTFPARTPRHRIDVVLAEPPIEVVSAEVVDSADVVVASDHRPVLAVLRLPA